MKSKGIYGFYKNGVSKLIGYEYGSNPTILGNYIKNFLEKTPKRNLISIFNEITMVDKRFTDSLSILQKDTSLYSKGIKYIENCIDFIKNSGCCEWCYVMNLDKNILEIYRGLQKKPDFNRYLSCADKNGYCNCILVKEVPFEKLNNFSMKDFQTEFFLKEYTNVV